MRPEDYAGPDAEPDPWFGRVLNLVIEALIVATAPISLVMRLVGRG